MTLANITFTNLCPHDIRIRHKKKDTIIKKSLRVARIIESFKVIKNHKDGLDFEIKRPKKSKVVTKHSDVVPPLQAAWEHHTHTPPPPVMPEEKPNHYYIVSYRTASLLRDRRDILFPFQTKADENGDMYCNFLCSAYNGWVDK